MYKEHKAKNGTATILLSGSKTKKELYDININQFDTQGYYRPDKSFTLLETSDYFKALEIFEKIVKTNYMDIIY